MEKTTKVAGTETSSDGLAWGAQENINIAGLIETLQNGERVFVRSTVVDVYPSGRTSLPKSGAIYELVARKMDPPRLIVAEEPKQLPEKKGE